MTPVLVTTQSTLEGRYTQKPSVHYLKATQKGFDFTQVKQQTIITCLYVIRYISYLFFCIYFYIGIHFYMFLYLFFIHLYIYLCINLYLQIMLFYIFIDYILIY